MKPAAGPVRHHVVLVGAGNAHLRFVRMFGMRPTPGVAVTLVNDGGVVPYSAMVPGHVGGEYAWDEVTIDLVRLCRMAGVRLVADRAIAVDRARRAVTFAGRAELRYHVLSLGVGSGVARPGGPPPPAPAQTGGEADTTPSLPMRPLAGLAGRLDALAERLGRESVPVHLAIVGGGASGCELTLAICKRFAGVPGFRVTLLHGPDRLLPGFPGRAAWLMANLLAERGVAVRTGTRVLAEEPGGLVLEGGGRLECDMAVWATHAAPPSLLPSTGLPLDAAGFLRVRDTLQSVGDPDVFGTGDCVAFDAYPGLPRNGVLAVRQGGVLFENVRRRLSGRPLIRFRPQAVWLGLLNTSDGQALLTYGPLAWRSRLARRLKDWIDRAWVRKFVPRPMPVPAADEESPGMRCGGCGSKVAGDVLSAVVGRLNVPDDPRVLVGVHGGEDAAVHRPPGSGGTVEVQSADFFRSFVDDPYLFGQVAAVHAVSDLHAMNARPATALAVATVPFARRSVQEPQLYEMLAGAADALRGLGVTLTGGHTTEGAELALGFAVTGYADEGRLFRKGGLRPGDRLVLTKPIGSGALLAAWMRAECRAEWFASLCRGLTMGNGPAAAVFDRAGVRACTDVTGFGLAGHLLEMLDAGGVGADLMASAVPLYPGFAEVTVRGVVSSLHGDNARHACRVECSPGTAPAWLFDPQTAGGLLAGVPADAADAVLARLRAAGCDGAAVVGTVTAGPPVVRVR